MAKPIFTLILTFIFFRPLLAQNEALELIRVEFWYPMGKIDQFVRIKKDGLSGEEYSESLKTRTWIKTNSGSIEKKPVAYVAGSRPRIGACFRKEGTSAACENQDPNSPPSSNFVDFYVRGEVIDPNNQPTGIKLPIKQLVKTGKKKTYEYTAEPLSEGFPENKVQYFENFIIKWEWSVSGNENGIWSEAGISTNRLYVTHQTPKTPGPHFYTCIHLGCSAAADETEKTGIVAKIQSRFASQCITRVDDPEGNCLKFWGDPVNAAQYRGLEYLLENAVGNKYEDATCGTWTDFFEEVLSIQGIQGNRITALAYNKVGSSLGGFSNSLEQTFLVAMQNFFGNSLFPAPAPANNPANVNLDNGEPGINQPGSGTRLVLHGTIAPNGATGNPELVIFSRFFVKNWNFAQGENQFYANLPEGEILEIKNASGVVIQTITGADMSGCLAQGGANHPNPISNFGDHVILQYNNQYYDPSYGKGPFENKSAWVNESLNGYGTLLTYHSPSNSRHRIFWLDKLASVINSETIKFNGL